MPKQERQAFTNHIQSTRENNLIQDTYSTLSGAARRDSRRTFLGGNDILGGRHPQAVDTAPVGTRNAKLDITMDIEVMNLSSNTQETWPLRSRFEDDQINDFSCTRNLYYLQALNNIST